MSAALTIAAPSKGRLQENSTAFFARAGLTLVQEGGARDYRGRIRDLPGVEVLFLSASEIVAKLASGDAHFGVTGEDLIREAMPDADARVALLAPLGFGQADVVVAVPKGWIDAGSMEDLEEIAADFHARHGRRMRVATKYVNLTRRFFAAHGVADYRIVESLGATEGAPSSGTAELIVDITTTGATLEANGLKVLTDGVILKSQANLVASLGAHWSDETLALARRILGRISAEQAARMTREVRVTAPAPAFAALAEVASAFGVETAPGETEGGIRAASFEIMADQAAAFADRLVEAGASSASVARADYVFRRQSPLYDLLTARLAKA
jgi:ATP phosphoribosyltransferase